MKPCSKMCSLYNLGECVKSRCDMYAPLKKPHTPTGDNMDTVAIVQEASWAFIIKGYIKVHKGANTIKVLKVPGLKQFVPGELPDADEFLDTITYHIRKLSNGRLVIIVTDERDIATLLEYEVEL